MPVTRWTFEDYWATQMQVARYYYSGYTETFTVPDTVYKLQFSIRGGTGGGNLKIGVPLGGYVSGWVDVEPGDTFIIRVGGPGGTPASHTGGVGGYGGGGAGGNALTAPVRPGGYGGGGSAAVFVGNTNPSSRVAVAAGAGGNNGLNLTGGPGGPDKGGTGLDPNHQGNGGQGATQTGGGLGGYNSPVAANGGLDFGGVGAANTSAAGVGGGGGGGGYYGGGGGGGGTFGQPGHKANPGSFPGGGGSNYTGGFNQDDPIISRPGTVVRNNAPGSTVLVYWTAVADFYTWEINPNDGGAISVAKNLQMSQNTGPNRVNIIQEGQSHPPVIPFSGTILTQTHLEALETWFDRRTFIKMTDDLGREYYGVFNQFTPKRVRHASNFWFHTYDAQFTASAYKNASGNWVYGRVV